MKTNLGCQFSNNKPHNLYKLNFRMVVIILSIITIITAATIINFSLYQHSASNQKVINSLSQVSEQIHQLNVLRWLIGSSREFTKDDLDQIYHNADTIAGNLYKLEQEFKGDKQFIAIHAAFSNYISSLSLFFNLINQGNFEQANVVAIQKVDPDYKKLNQFVTKVLKEYYQYGPIKQRTLFTSSVVVTIISVICLFFLARKLRSIHRNLLTNDILYEQTKYIFDTSTEGICLIDRDYNIVLSNNHYVKKFGNSLGKKCYELCFNQLCYTDKCHVNRIINGESVVEETVEMKSTDGSTVYYFVSSCPYYDTNGHLIGIVANYVDITERRKAARLGRHYKLIGDNARDILLFTNTDGSIVEANKAASQVYGYTKEELLSLSIYDLFIKEYQSSTMNSMEFADEKGLVFEAVNQDKKGINLPVEVSLQRADFEDETIIVSVIRDITERKQAERLLKEQKEFAENLIHNLAIPAFVLDSQHKVLVWNKACEELMGIKAEEVVGTDERWTPYLKKYKRCLADTFIDNSLDGLSERYKVWNKSNLLPVGLHAESWMKFKGEDKYIIFEAAPIFDNDKNLVAVIETLQDITPHKNAEETLFRYNQKIHQELELASKVQRSMLPKELPNSPNIEFAWKFKPSVYVAGDMLNIFSLDEDNIGFYILDVKGHGISAALNAVTVNHLLRPNYRNTKLSDTNTAFSPSNILTQLNEYFLDEMDAFFTIFYGIINTKNLVMTYVRAGHCPPVVVPGDGSTVVLDKGGVAMGLLKNTVYEDNIIKLKPGDKILLYTDGAIENGNKVSDNPFLINDLEALINTNRNCSVSEIVDTIVLEAKRRTESLEVRDDITVMGIQII